MPKKESSNGLLKIAKVVRVVSIPPVMVAALIVLLSTLRNDVFTKGIQIVLAFLFLAVFPVLSYPVCYLVPRLRKKGRDAQRNVAFIFTGIGYVAGWIWAMFLSSALHQKFIYSVYFFSFLLLAIANIFHVKSSAHACSCTGPIILCALYLGIAAIIIGVLFYALIFWASIKTKRHTVKQFLLGTLTCFVACAAAWLIFRPVF